jgi:hypothetical protein
MGALGQEIFHYAGQDEQERMDEDFGGSRGTESKPAKLTKQAEFFAVRATPGSWCDRLWARGARDRSA